MSEVFIGQVMPVAFGFAPRYFATCDGQIMPIAQNSALFSLLGTQYGGNGQTTFALPDLRGRTPIGSGAGYPIGQAGGSEAVTLTSQNLPQHAHDFVGTSASATTRNPNNTLFGASTLNLYASTGGSQVALDPRTVAPTGESQPHDNMQPYRVINFCIALSGIFPSRN